MPEQVYLLGADEILFEVWIQGKAEAERVEYRVGEIEEAKILVKREDVGENIVVEVVYKFLMLGLVSGIDYSVDIYAS